MIGLPLPALTRLDLRRAVLGTSLVGVSLVFAMEIGHRPTLIRLLFATLVVGGLFVFSTMDARGSVLAVFALLPFLGLSRRLLISSTGWPARDPLVLIGSAFVGLLIVRLFLLERRSLSGDRISQLVLALLLIVSLQSVNPRGGGLSAGAGGFLYVGAPMLWYFVGRELLDRRTVRRLFGALVVLGSVVALYGLLQMLNGFPSWDARWISDVGLESLSVHGKIRAFGTFPSSSEYAAFLGVALIVALSNVSRGLLAAFAIVCAPLLAAALFLDGTRGTVVSAVFALFVMAGFKTGSLRTAVATIAIGTVVAGLLLHSYAGSLQTRATATGNPFVTHQVGGLTDPLNSQNSTLLIHLQMVTDGVVSGIRDPVGHGTASISLGGSQLGGARHSTEFDISNAFVGLGVVGGAVFALLVLAIFRAAARLYLGSRDVVVLAALGLLVVTFGQWLNGGLYTVTPLVWLLAGWIVSETRIAAAGVKGT